MDRSGHVHLSGVWSRRGMIVGLILAMLILSNGVVTAQETVKLAGALALEYVGAFAAIQKGFYAEEGIKIEGPTWMGGARVRDGLFAKDYDFALLTLPVPAIARAKGMPFKAIFPLYEKQIFSLFGRKDLPNREKAASDLKGFLRGLRVGQSGTGTSSWVFAAHVYRTVGLDPLRDMQLATLGMSPQLYLGAIRSGRVDVITLWEPMITLAEDEGLIFPVVDIRDAKTHKQFFGQEEALSEVLVTREDVIREKPDLVRRMVKATRKGLEYVRSRPAAELAELIRPLVGGLDQDLLTRIFERLKPAMADGSFSVSSYEASMRPLVENGILKEMIPFEELVDSTFAGRRR